MTALLLVEDDPSLGETLCGRLGKEGYQVQWATSQATGEQLCDKHRFDAAIIDIGLPDGDGFALARTIRESQKFPFLFLTAMSSAEFRLEGFEIGAADFIPKPFHLKELLLRLKQVVRKNMNEGEIAGKGFVLDLSARAVRYTDGTIEYPSERDFQLLNSLIQASPLVVSRKEVLEKVWQSGEQTNNRTVDNAILRIRQLLSKTGCDPVQAVRGVGYRWVEG